MKNKLQELRSLNNNLDEKINSENQVLFTDMICYIRSANISEINQEMVRRDLSEIVLSAQSRGENIRDVIDGDFKEFCDEVISNISPRTAKEKWVDRLDLFFSSMAILGIINIFFSSDFRKMITNIADKQPVDYNIGISVGMVVSIFIIMTVAVFTIDRIGKNALKKESDLSPLKKVIIGGFIGAVLVVIFLAVRELGSQILFEINIFVAIACIMSFFIGHKLLSRI